MTDRQARPRKQLYSALATVWLTLAILGSAGPATAEMLQRLITLPLGAEVTGIAITPAGDLFFNAQHPNRKNAKPFNRAFIGALPGVDFLRLGARLPKLAAPKGEMKQWARSALGELQIVARAGDVWRYMPHGLGGITNISDVKLLHQSRNPDFNAFVPTNDQATEGYLFTSWENRPGGVSRLQLKKGPAGRWRVLPQGTGMVNFANVNGVWGLCFGSLSPWGTPLISEELFFSDTSQWNNPRFRDFKRPSAMARYLGRFPNPYDYGYIIELRDPKAITRPVKRLALGRFGHENAVIMADRRTVYLSDDARRGGFFKFIADSAGDLSAGTLFAAKLRQKGGRNPAKASFDIAWIKLAHGRESEIARWVRQYDGITPEHYRRRATNFISGASIFEWTAGKARDDRVAFLETRRAAEAKGATIEFSKMEGLAVDPGVVEVGKDGVITAPKHLYMAITRISHGMADTRGDIRLRENPCGAIYALALDPDYNVRHMKPALMGGPAKRYARKNICPLNNIANPDNLLVLADGRLLIGEDSTEHENNVLWLWTPKH